MKGHSLPINAALPELGLRLPIFWIKELRVILPAILGCAFILLLSPKLPHEIRNSIIYLFYPATCSAVFALAFGHDYMHRTLTATLALPVERHKIFWTRTALCTAALLPLALIQFMVTDGYIWLFRRVTFFVPWHEVALRLVGEPILTAICLAPYLTLLSRSVLFGAIISTTAPFALDALVRAVALGTGLDQNVRFFSLPIAALIPFIVAGTFLGYRRFITQEAIESDVSVAGRTPRAARSRPARSGPSGASQISNLKSQIALSSAGCELFKKEVMLQRLPAAIAALCVVIVFFASKDHAAMLSVFYPATIVILVGAIASAEERRMGLIPSQVAHPIRFGKQWLIKIVVAYFTALLCGVILPAVALLFKTDELNSITADDALAALPFICGGTLLLLSVAIYISSISENGIRAMLASLFVVIVATMVIGAGYNAFVQYLWRTLADERLIALGLGPDGIAWRIVELRFQVWSFALTVIGFIPLLLYFAMQNHRYLDRSGRRLFRQAGALILYALAALALIAALLNTLRFDA